MNIAADTTSIKDEQIEHLKSEVTYRIRLQEICNKINAAENLDGILFNLIEDITSLFNAERMTLFVVNTKRRELVSRYKSENDISEIRVPILLDSIAGWCALKLRPVNLKNTYDAEELAAVDPDLKFDKSWDHLTGFTTRQLLAVPILFQKYLMGVIQLVNRKTGTAFSATEIKSLEEMAKILGIALYNQRRLATRSTTGKFDSLVENHLLTQKELQQAIEEARENQIPVAAVLTENFNILKKDIVASLGKFYNVEAVEYDPGQPIPGDLMMGLKVPFLKHNFWVPLGSEEGKVLIAIDNPHDLQRIGEITSLFPGQSLKFCVALKQDILDYITLFTQEEKQLAEIDEILLQAREEAEEIEEAETAIGEEDNTVVKLVNKIVLDAHERDASDIHIEPYPGKENTDVRIRIDGDCMLYQTIPFNYKSAVISRIKIMSDLDIAEHRRPQDGKIQFKKYGGKDIELRVATIPTQGGLEDVVIRILDSKEPLPLDNIGFSKRNFENFSGAVSEPYGLIFVCGPTGSGKTTTLHSALKYINKPETKIWTAEDPVEITQRGLRQVQIMPKINFDFAAALRAFLRSDPDVIMVGEMRDRETTSIGIQASLTGHLVLSTLHTNNAPESVTRLLDMGMDPFNFADAVNCVLAQRLGHTLCKDCRQTYHPTQAQYDELLREYGTEEFKANVNIDYSDGMELSKAVGCKSCNNSGYRSRMALHELLMGTDEIKRLIQSKARVDEIRSQAIKDGMTTLKQDGIEKIFTGALDLLQVRKVCIK
jgi:type II secretory ATPase GspE/PulE/Tfp pilus assembly ATPase PilB-like protein